MATAVDEIRENGVVIVERLFAEEQVLESVTQAVTRPTQALLQTGEKSALVFSICICNIGWHAFGYTCHGLVDD